VNFYYPEETLASALQKNYQQQENEISQSVSSSPVTDVNHLNFNYKLSGDSPEWRPIRVFDDGTKTFIEMPPISERMDLPVLYITKERQLQLVNYRYRRPYYIVDSLFKNAYLISDKGHEQVRVEIHNRNFN
jgi:type IV secretion system protein VirB9